MPFYKQFEEKLLTQIRQEMLIKNYNKAYRIFDKVGLRKVEPREDLDAQLEADKLQRQAFEEIEQTCADSLEGYLAHHFECPKLKDIQARIQQAVEEKAR